MGNEEGSTPEEKAVETMEVEIEGKLEKFDKERVINLKKQQASATQKTQQVAKILAAADRYGVDADTFADKSEAALDVLGGLIEQGYLDAQGNVVSKSADPPTDPPKDSPLPPGNAGAPSEDLKALQAQYAGLQGTMEELKKDTASIIRKSIGESIKSKFPDLDDDDVVKTLNVAFQDRSKNPFEHAQDISKKKIQLREEQRKEFAKEHGIDLDAYNKRKSQDPDGGIGAVIKGKKIVFNPKGPNEISPADAEAEWQEMQKV